MWIGSVNTHLFGVYLDAHTSQFLASLAEARCYKLKLCPTPLAFLEQFDRSVPGCVLAEFSMPDGGGWEIVEVVQAEQPEIPIIFLSDAHMDVAAAVELMKNGVMDVHIKPVCWASLTAGIDRAVDRDALTKRAFAAGQVARAHYTLLTRREREVFKLVVSGLPSKGIARVLDRSQKTVEVHRTSIMKKMEAKSVVDLVRMGIELSVLDQETGEFGSTPPRWKNRTWSVSAHDSLALHEQKA